MAKVWNDHSQVHKEKFDGVEIVIPPKGYVEMEHFDALRFMGQFVPIKKDGLGNPMTFKMLRLESAGPNAVSQNEHRCQLCRGKFDTENELFLHSEAVHKAALIAEPEEKKKRATNA